MAGAGTPAASYAYYVSVVACMLGNSGFLLLLQHIETLGDGKTNGAQMLLVSEGAKLIICIIFVAQRGFAASWLGGSGQPRKATGGGELVSSKGGGAFGGAGPTGAGVAAATPTARRCRLTSASPRVLKALVFQLPWKYSAFKPLVVRYQPAPLHHGGGHDF